MNPAQQLASNAAKIYRVLIVDDSKAMCAFLKKVLDADPELSVVGCALDPYEARDMIKRLNPDILTLDIEMPKMDGLTFLKNLMRLRPMPVVMISSMTSAGASASLEALSIGAVDFMVKRQIHSPNQLQLYTSSICNLVRSAAGAKPSRMLASNKGKRTVIHRDVSSWRDRLAKSKRASTSVDKVICIGASTGGPEAVKHLLESLKIPRTAVIITQHMPTRFIGPFAERLNKNSSYNIEASYEGAPLTPGKCYVACGESHTAIDKTKSTLCCKLLTGDKVSGHQPSVDALFSSAAETLGSAAIGILLTGMGSDGAAGLKAMRHKGALTIAQDEKSSAVWGMPGSAVRLDAADAVLPLQDISHTLIDLLQR